MSETKGICADCKHPWAMHNEKREFGFPVTCHVEGCLCSAVIGSFPLGHNSVLNDSSQGGK